MRLSLIFFIIFSLISFSFEKMTKAKCKADYDHCLTYQTLAEKNYEVHKRNCAKKYINCLKYLTF